MLKDFRDPKEFPRPFWVLMVATFIDRIGFFLLLPFFALYVTQRFALDMTALGGVFFVFAFSGTIGSFIGGAIADKFGRRRIILFGLVFSAASSLLLGFIGEFSLFVIVTLFVGLLQDVGGPAQSALVADVLPSRRQSEGFGIWRVVANLAAVIGPLVGGLLAHRNFLYLFVGDAALSFLTAVVVYLALPETKPRHKEGQSQQNLLQIAVGYRKVFGDRIFMTFILVAIFGVMMYAQIDTSMPVFLRDVHNFPPQFYGYLLSLNAIIVVLLQFWITRKMKGYAPLVLMALGTLLLAAGFAMYGFGAGFLYFAVAMAIITVGEMIIAPTGQALAARLAPAEMRGRYMAMFAFSWSFPFAIGPVFAGIITDNVNFYWVWYASGIVGILCVLGYLALNARAGAGLGKMGDEILQVGVSAQANPIPNPSP